MTFAFNIIVDICAQRVYDKNVHISAQEVRLVTPGEKMRKLRGKRPMRDVAKCLGVSLSSYVKYEDKETPEIL